MLCIHPFGYLHPPFVSLYLHASQIALVLCIPRISARVRLSGCVQMSFSCVFWVLFLAF